MKKIVHIFLLIILLIASVFCVWKNYDSIIEYVSNKEWEITESVGSVLLSNYYTINGTSSNLVVVGNNYITGYSSNAKENFDESVSLKDAITDANGDYCIVGENGGMKVYMLNGSNKIWDTQINGTVLNVSVNKNGYSAVVFKQTGYKSLIKIMNPEGKELFTNYLATTYAIDAQISNDNKKLAIAEIDTDGIKVQSAIKLIDINNLKEENVEKIDLPDDTLVVNIEYNDKNQLLIHTDSAINIISDGKIKDVIMDLDNVNIATIENKNNAITISKVENGLFDLKYILSICEYNDTKIEKKEYELEEIPSILVAQNKNIAMLLEDELIVVNTNGKLIKRCNVSGNVKSIVLFDNGNSVALIFRDKIEFIKI